MMPESEILRELVAIPSVSSMSNQPVIDYVLKRLVPKTWHIRTYSYRDAAGIPKTNLVAITKQNRSRRARPELALICHTDTVPFDPAWKAALSGRVLSEKLYGRGSCDVKAFLACILAVISDLDVPSLSKPLALVLTADEEIGCVGAKYLARKKAFRARYAIIGEPTGLRPVHAGKGYGLAEIIVRGAEAHSAFPDRGRSAIYDASRIVFAIERIAKIIARRKNAAFDPPFTTLNIGLIQGGTAKNIVPGECRITVEWRPVAGQDPRWAPQLIEQELDRLSREYPGLDARLDVKRLDPQFEGAGSQLARLLESINRSRATTVAFGTEAAHLRELTTETVVYGPGEMTVAHKTGEYVKVSDLRKCTACLKTVIKKLCTDSVIKK